MPSSAERDALEHIQQHLDGGVDDQDRSAATKAASTGTPARLVPARTHQRLACAILHAMFPSGHFRALALFNRPLYKSDLTN